MALLVNGLNACAAEELRPSASTATDAGNRARVWHEEDTPRRHPEAAFREVGAEGGFVVLPSRAEVKVLNLTGVRVFSLLDGKHTLRAIARAITDEFEVDYTTALRDVIGFVKELDKHGMLTPNASLAEE